MQAVTGRQSTSPQPLLSADIGRKGGNLLLNVGRQPNDLVQRSGA